MKYVLRKQGVGRESGMVELDVKIEAGDLYDYMLRHSYNSPAGILGSTFGAVLILFALMTKQWAFIVHGLNMHLYLPWTLFFKSRKQILANPSFQKPLHYVLDQEGIAISQGEDQVKYLWDELYRAVSTGRSIIVYTSRVNATIFPKRALGDQKMAVIEMISTHMSPARVKIRG